MARPTIKECRIHNTPRIPYLRKRGNRESVENICVKCRKEWSNKYFSVQRHHHLKRYGITLTEYNKLLIAQNERCGICKKHKSEFNKAFAVDHCHTTGKVRGLLCFACNTGIGKLQDSTEVLMAALAYLSKDNS